MTLLERDWDESKHPREPAGSAEGGRFAGGGAADAAEEVAKPPPGYHGQWPEHPAGEPTASLKQQLDWQAQVQQEQLGEGKVTPAGYMRQYGRAFAFGDDSFSGKKGPMKQCYKNAAIMVIEDHARGDNKLTYVEGYLDFGGLPLQHAWVVDNETKRVIDPTVRATDKIEGYLGVPFKYEYLRKTLVRKQTYGVLSDYENIMTVLADNPADVVEAKLLTGSTPKKDWDEAKHPREPAGSSAGGQFAGGASDERGDWAIHKEPDLNPQHMNTRSLQEAVDRGGFEFK